jgi:hypothetical protein
MKRKIILLHEINYYKKVYPGCEKLKQLKDELKSLKSRHV